MIAEKKHAGCRRWMVVAAGVLGSMAGEAGAQVTEGATPLARGDWRLDVDAYTRVEDRARPERDGERLRAEGWGWMQLGVGVGERIEVRAGWQAYQRERIGGETTEGAGDVWLMAKIGLVGDESEGPAWGVMPFVKLPTAGARWADDTLDAGLLLIHGRPLGESGFFNAQLGWEDYGDGTRGRDQGLGAALAAGRALGSRWTIYGEALADLYPRNGDSGDFSAMLGAGLVWSGSREGSWGIDLAGYGGLNFPPCWARDWSGPEAARAPGGSTSPATAG